MNEVIPGIYRLKVPLPTSSFLGYVNTYLLQSDPGYLLIDTGWNTEEAYKAVVSQLAEIGTDIKQISRILITHIHPDHYGLAGRLKQISAATVYVHYLETSMIQSRYVDMPPLLEQTIAWLQLNGVPPDEAPYMQTASVEMAKKYVMAIRPDVELRGGETISTGVFNLQVILTPGHSKGQVCFFEPDRKILFSGDHILPHITPNIGLHPQSSANPIGDFITSLKEIREMDVRLVLPAHENPFTRLKQRIDQLLRHHEKRNSHIMDQLKTGASTAYEIATGIPWLTDSDGVSFEKLSLVNRRLAILETLAHLEALRVKGKITRFIQNGTAYFQVT